jgi:hypothetical protein
MNKYSSLILLGCLLLAASCGWCQDASTAQPGNHQRNRPGAETRLLQQLLHMEDQQLTNLRQTIERIEQMTPEEKAQLRGRIGTIRKMPPEKVDAMRKQYKAIPKEQRQAMRQRWLELSPEQRAEWRGKLRDMSHEERTAAFQQQGFLPPPPHRDKKGPRPAHRSTPPAQAERAPQRAPGAGNK